MAGLNPKNSDEVNSFVGSHLRQFVEIKETINRDREVLAPLDLKVDPYNMSAEDETLIKSAMNQLDTTLDTVDMTFISRLIGLF